MSDFLAWSSVTVQKRQPKDEDHIATLVRLPVPLYKFMCALTQLRRGDSNAKYLASLVKKDAERMAAERGISADDLIRQYAGYYDSALGEDV